MTVCENIICAQLLNYVMYLHDWMWTKKDTEQDYIWVGFFTAALKV